MCYVRVWGGCLFVCFDKVSIALAGLEIAMKTRLCIQILDPFVLASLGARVPGIH